MNDEPSSEDLTGQVEYAVSQAQKLDGYKQQILQEMREEGYTDGARVFIASEQPDGRIRVDRFDIDSEDGGEG